MKPLTYFDDGMNLDKDTVVVVMFEKSGQVSSLMRAHPEQEWEKGWNAAVEAMLRYIPQPTLERYNAAVKALKSN